MRLLRIGLLGSLTLFLARGFISPGWNHLTMIIIHASIVADLKFRQIMHRTVKVAIYTFFYFRSELGLVVIFLHWAIIFTTKLSIVVKLLGPFIIRILPLNNIFRPFGLHFLLNVHFHLTSFYWALISQRCFAFIDDTFLGPFLFAEGFGVLFGGNWLMIRFLSGWEAWFVHGSPGWNKRFMSWSINKTCYFALQRLLKKVHFQIV